MTAPDPMPLVERLRVAAPLMTHPYDSEAFLEAADEVERLTAALEAEKAEVFRLRDALAQAKGVPSASVLLAEQVLHMDMVTERGLRARELARQVLDESHDVHEGECAAVLRDLASMLGAGGYNAPAVDAKVFREKILWGIDELKNVAAPPPSPAQAAGWRDIESAPRDGSYFLMGNQHGAWVGSHQPKAVSGYVFDNPWRSLMLNHWHIRKDVRYEPATHWMPLPAAPGHPPSERQGLTDEQIMGIAFGERFSDGTQYLLALARAIERAHGIGIVPATPEQEKA